MHRLEVRQGAQGRWRWSIRKGAVGVAWGPVHGYETREEAETQGNAMLPSPCVCAWWKPLGVGIVAGVIVMAALAYLGFLTGD